MELSMGALQAYLLDHYGGRANEQGLFMKLVEEMGEVAGTATLVNIINIPPL